MKWDRSLKVRTPDGELGRVDAAGDNVDWQWQEDGKSLCDADQEELELRYQQHGDPPEDYKWMGRKVVRRTWVWTDEVDGQVDP